MGNCLSADQVCHVNSTATYWYLSQTAAQVSTALVIVWRVEQELQNQTIPEWELWRFCSHWFNPLILLLMHRGKRGFCIDKKDPQIDSCSFCCLCYTVNCQNLRNILETLYILHFRNWLYFFTQIKIQQIILQKLRLDLNIRWQHYFCLFWYIYIYNRQLENS